uniref:Uncharacterized protein n=1 Tax=Arundo donax TaxID=35708 RepID=A0A0A9E0F9_ARUDO
MMLVHNKDHYRRNKWRHNKHMLYCGSAAQEWFRC